MKSALLFGLVCAIVVVCISALPVQEEASAVREKRGYGGFGGYGGGGYGGGFGGGYGGYG